MRAGFCKACITPPLGQVSFAGYTGRKQFPRGVMIDEDGTRHELHARALFLEPDGNRDPSKRMCLVTSDLFMIRNYWVNQVRELAHELTGIPVENICIHATHSHQAPDTLGIYYPGHDFDGSYLDDEWVAFLKRQVAGTIYGAWKDARHCLIGTGEGMLEGYTINRREVGLFDRPNKNPRTIDPQVPVLLVSEPDGTPRVVLTGYATHPTFLTTVDEWATEHVTFLDKQVKKVLGKKVELMYFTGQAGDVVPFVDASERVQLVLNPGERPLKKHQVGVNISKTGGDKGTVVVENMGSIASKLKVKMDAFANAIAAEHGSQVTMDGATLVVEGAPSIREVFLTVSKVTYNARSVTKTKKFSAAFTSELRRVVRGITPEDINDISIGRETIDIEIDDPDMAEQYKVLVERAGPARSKDGKTTVKSEVQGVKVGNAYIALLPSEPVNEIGMRLKKLIKDQAGAGNAFLFQMCNDGFGYVVPEFEHDSSGYEVEIFCFGRMNGDIIEKATLKLASRILGKKIAWKDVQLPVFRQAEWTEDARLAKEAWLAKQ